MLALAVSCGGVACRARHERQEAPPAAIDTAAGPAPEAAATGDTVVRGVVAVVGADPFAEVVVSAGGRSAAVVGSLRAELGTLHGVEVEVRGRAVGNPHGTPGRAIEVERYEIIAIAGERPFVGTLEARAGGLWIDGMRLVGAPDDLVGAVGGKVWVIGRNEDGRLAVRGYGVIRRADQ